MQSVSLTDVFVLDKIYMFKFRSFLFRELSLLHKSSEISFCDFRQHVYIYEVDLKEMYVVLFFVFIFSELKKLSEESLTRQPEEVFDIICKLGEG